MPQNLTWENLSKTLSRQFGEDIAQDILANYLKKNTKIQHGIRYFRKAGKWIRLAKVRQTVIRRESFHKQAISRIHQQSQGPGQLTRVMLAEVWDKLPEESRSRLLTGENPAKTSSARVRQFRLRKRLNGD